MQPFGWINGAWVLVLVLGLIGVSCTTRVTTDNRPLTPDPWPLTAIEPDTATKTKVQAVYGQLPFHFEANQGQTDEQVKFLSRGSSYTLFLTSTEVVFTLRKPHKNSLAPTSDSPSSLQLHRDPLAPVSGERVRVRGLDPEQAKPTEPTVLRMKLVGANPAPQVTGLGELPGKSNYFLGNDPKKWHTNVLTYAKVKYKDVYPGVDLVYYGNQRQLEYDFVISPGADPKIIKLAFGGADKVEIDAQGDIILRIGDGEIHLHKTCRQQGTHYSDELIETVAHTHGR